MPIVKAHVIHDMSRECLVSAIHRMSDRRSFCAQNIVRILDVIRGSGQRYPDVGAELNALYST